MDVRKLTILVIAGSMIPMLAGGCGAARRAPAEKPAVRRVTYVCADGTTFTASFGDQKAPAIVALGGKIRTLSPLASASGAQYSDGTVTLWTKDDTARIEEKQGASHADCTPARSDERASQEGPITPVHASPLLTPGGPPKPRPELVGRLWRLVEIRDAGEGTRLPKEGSQYTLQLLENGRAAAHADCNRGMGSWRAEDDGRFTLGMFAFTRAACPEGSLFFPFSQALTNVGSYLVREGTLVLTLKDGGGSLTFQATR